MRGLPRTDPLKNMGIALTSIGAAGLFSSSIMIATAPPGPLINCQFGCAPGFGGTPIATNSDRHIAGAGLFGVSLFTTLLGAPLWAVGALEEPLDAGSRASDGTLLTAVGFTVFGAATAAGGAFAGLANNGISGTQTAPVLEAIIGTGSMLAGLPLWVVGTRRVTPPGGEGPKLGRRSRRMMVGGITLTILGAASMGVGAILASFGRDSGLQGFSGGMTFTSLGLVMAGIPMWYFGQEKVPESTWVSASAAPPPVAYEVAPLGGQPARRAMTAAPNPPPRAAYRPELQVGPTSVSMRFMF
jgi:hypothetical protein